MNRLFSLKHFVFSRRFYLRFPHNLYLKHMRKQIWGLRFEIWRFFLSFIGIHLRWKHQVYKHIRVVFTWKMCVINRSRSKKKASLLCSWLCSCFQRKWKPEYLEIIRSELERFVKINILLLLTYCQYFLNNSTRDVINYNYLVGEAWWETTYRCKWRTWPLILLNCGYQMKEMSRIIIQSQKLLYKKVLQLVYGIVWCYRWIYHVLVHLGINC
jgi:hypothetical protein